MGSILNLPIGLVVDVGFGVQNNPGHVTAEVDENYEGCVDGDEEQQHYHVGLIQKTPGPKPLAY